MKEYGKELILDLHNCDAAKFDRKNIRNYFKNLCDLIHMERCKLTWWDDYGVPPEEQQTEPHLKGTSAVQFIKTSNITIHTLELLKAAYINIFSCKAFDEKKAKQFTQEWFRGKVVTSKIIVRK